MYFATQKNKFGFTLAEVLITLGIIGVVASLVIPAVSKNIRHYELQQQFKKYYAIISQASAQTQNELGGDGFWKYCTYYNGSNYVNSSECVNTFYRQVKLIGKKNYASPVINYNNSANAFFTGIGTETPTHILADGASIDFKINSTNINISIDINGPLKRPNRSGYDIFVFFVDKKDAVRPYGFPNPPGAQNVFYICNKTSTETWNGLACGYWALLDKNPDDPTKGYWESLD